MKKFWLGFVAGIVLIVLVFFATYMVMVNRLFDAVEQDYQPQENITAPIELPTQNVIDYQEIIDTSKPIVALFYVDWCGYCRRFMPIFGDYAKKYNKDFTFAIINCDLPENRAVALENNIRSFPTLKIIDKQIDYAVPVDIGATQSEKIFEQEVKKHLKLRQKLVK